MKVFWSSKIPKRQCLPKDQVLTNTARWNFGTTGVSVNQLTVIERPIAERNVPNYTVDSLSYSTSSDNMRPLCTTTKTTLPKAKKNLKGSKVTT